MRFELALAVGIIFFCSWCAYIIIKMNSSLTQQQQESHQTAPEAPDARTRQGGNQQNMGPDQLKDHYLATQTRPSGARLAPEQPPDSWRQAGPLAFGPQVGSGRPTPLAAWPAASLAGLPARAQKQARPSHQAIDSLEEGPEEEAEGEELKEQEQEGEEAPPPGTTRRHSEEIEAGRSFSQNDSESAERDRAGNPIRAYRRHLINGKPVRGQQQPQPQPQDGADFDRVVDEIETDDGGGGEEQDEQADGPAEQSERPDQPERQPEESESRLNAISSGAGRPSAAATATATATARTHNFGRSRPEEIDEHSEDDLPPAKVKDSHKHRLKESLRAQQWDDDTATANPTVTPASVSVHGDRPANEEADPGEEQAEPEAEAEAATDGQPEESEVVFRDLDELVDGRFPFLDSERPAEQSELARTRRSALELIRVARSAVVDFGSELDADNNDGQQQHLWASKRQLHKTNNTDSRRVDALTRENDHPVYGRPNSSELQPPSGPQFGLAAQSKSGPEFEFGSKSSSHDNGWRRNDKPAVWLANATGRAGDDIVVGQEDLSIELLADPPPLDPSAHQSGNGSLLVPPSNGHSAAGPQTAEPATASPAPQVGQSDAANGLQVASGTKLKGDRKRLQKSRNSKHHASRAASMRRKSKLKKGGLAKRKANRGKKYAKSHKQFSGTTRGKKGAKGVGQRGAKKGTLFYKDKGYKKRGFKKNYQKVESGDHKTYFDEFRDKDHKKKWRDFKDKHHYSHGKKWAADDRRRYNNLSAKELKDKKYALGRWREKERTKYRKDFAKKSKSKSMEQSKKAKKRHNKDHLR